MYVCRILCGCIIFLAGCQSNWAPVDDINRAPAKLSGQHIVQSGETLYAISWRYGRDFKELAQVNNIAPPYNIYAGQEISLEQPKPSETKAQPIIVPKTQEQVQTPPPVVSQAATTSTPLKWQGQWHWPVKGEIIGRFAQTKGIDIAGVDGEIIHAAADGQVVYSGTGLRGYGQLVIIKHNEQYLSAYAHNRKLMVKEGEWIKIGQPIAEMGNTGTNRVKLHFEIRQDGKPVDPLRYLPK